MIETRMQRRLLVPLISASLASAALVGATGPAKANTVQDCQPAIVQLPMPPGQTNGDVLAGVLGEAIGYVADDAQHQHVAVWRRSGGSWTVRDLGDFGLSVPFSGLSGTGVNRSGQASIGVNTGVGMAGWILTGGHVHRLHDFARGTAAYARAINDAGIVVGEALDAHGNDFAALWMHWWSRPRKLAPAPGYDGSFAQGIDNAGQVVGGSFANDSRPTLAMRWSARGVPLVLTSPGADAQAWAVSQRAGSVGDAVTANGQRAVRWDARDIPRTVGVFAGLEFSRLLGENTDGVAVGWEGINPPPPAIPVRRVLLQTSHGPARSLLPISRNWSDNAYAHGIDDAGTVYGTSATSAQPLTVPTVWTCAIAQSFIPDDSSR